MTGTTRQLEIMDYLKSHGLTRKSDLTRYFGVSDKTIRNNIATTRKSLQRTGQTIITFLANEDSLYFLAGMDTLDSDWARISKAGMFQNRTFEQSNPVHIYRETV